jgi:formylglycine-generating enzyme required for sulfatase activity
MKQRYFSLLLALLFLFSFTNANAGGSGLNVHCEGSDVGAEVSVNGVFKGECPLVIEVAPGKLTLRAFKSDSNYDYIFEQDIRMGDGAMKDINVVLDKRLNAAGQQAEDERLAAERKRLAAESEAAVRREAQLQEAERRKREALQAELAHYLTYGFVMVPIPGKNYELGKYDVTQAEWRVIMGNTPSRFTRCGDNCPVEQVSWFDVQEFLKKLNTMNGKQYRLPTNEEWDFACYGGAKTGFFSTPNYCGGNDIDVVAWYLGNSNGSTHPVGQKQANGYGLYDMSGNVHQWMQNEHLRGHFVRGGNWANNKDDLRADIPAGYESDLRDNCGIGFRLARTLP